MRQKPTEYTAVNVVINERGACRRLREAGFELVLQLLGKFLIKFEDKRLEGWLYCIGASWSYVSVFLEAIFGSPTLKRSGKFILYNGSITAVA